MGFERELGVSEWVYGKKAGKTTLSKRDREFLWLNAKKRCENPSCRIKLDFLDMEAGHKNLADSKGGKRTLGNSVCLCHNCNRRQYNDSWKKYMKKQGVSKIDTATSSKKKTKNKKKSKRKSSFNIWDVGK